jgi:hypothetical protein
MNDKTKFELESYRKEKQEFSKSKKIAMDMDAKDIMKLVSIVRNLDGLSFLNKQDVDTVNGLAEAAEKALNSAMVRWVMMGMASKEIAQSFKVPTSRVSKVKREIDFFYYK